MQKIENQAQVWDRIARDWYNFKQNANPEILEFVAKAKGKLLDLGCATGRYFTKTKATIYGVDFSLEMLKYAKKKAEKLGINVELVAAAGDDLPFEDNFFDYVISVAMLHCVQGRKNRINVLQELHRVLKKGGKAVISVWNRESPRFGKKEERLIKWMDKGERYYYFYTEKELIEELREVGFKVIKSESNNGEKIFQNIVVYVER